MIFVGASRSQPAHPLSTSARQPRYIVHHKDAMRRALSLSIAFVVVYLCFDFDSTYRQQLLPLHQTNSSWHHEVDDRQSTSHSTCIAMLLTNYEADIHNALLAIRSLDDNLLSGDFVTPFLVFNEGDITPEHQSKLKSATRRKIHFPYVNFSVYPTGFYPDKEEGPSFFKRTKFGYQQMCAFWITHIWKHKALSENNCETIMRMDADSCFLDRIDQNESIPGLNSKDLVYRANRIVVEKQYIEGMWSLTNKFLTEKRLVPRHVELWNRANETFRQHGHMLSFYNNFEISRVEFFQREEVMEYQNMMTEQEPFGVYRKRWGDAVVRYLTLALFAFPHEIHMAAPTAYAHGGRKWAEGMNRGCPNILLGDIKFSTS